MGKVNPVTKNANQKCSRGKGGETGAKVSQGKCSASAGGEKRASSHRSGGRDALEAQVD